MSLFKQEDSLVEEDASLEIPTDWNTKVERIVQETFECGINLYPFQTIWTSETDESDCGTNILSNAPVWETDLQPQGHIWKTESQLKEPIWDTGLQLKEPAWNTAFKAKEPTWNTGLQLQEPAWDTAFKAKEPTWDTGLQLKEPAMDIAFKRKELTWNTGLQLKEPTWNTGLQLKEPTWNTGLQLKEPTWNTGLQLKEPTWNTGLQLKEPTWNTGLQLKEPTWNTGLQLKEPAMDTAFKGKELTWNTGLQLKEPTWNTGLQLKEPTWNTDLELKEPACWPIDFHVQESTGEADFKTRNSPFNNAACSYIPTYTSFSNTFQGLNIDQGAGLDLGTGVMDSTSNNDHTKSKVSINPYPSSTRDENIFTLKEGSNSATVPSNNDHVFSEQPTFGNPPFQSNPLVQNSRLNFDFNSLIPKSNSRQTCSTSGQIQGDCFKKPHSDDSDFKVIGPISQNGNPYKVSTYPHHPGKLYENIQHKRHDENNNELASINFALKNDTLYSQASNYPDSSVNFIDTTFNHRRAENIKLFPLNPAANNFSPQEFPCHPGLPGYFRGGFQRLVSNELERKTTFSNDKRNDTKGIVSYSPSTLFTNQFPGTLSGNSSYYQQPPSSDPILLSHKENLATLVECLSTLESFDNDVKACDNLLGIASLTHPMASPQRYNIEEVVIVWKYSHRQMEFFMKFDQLVEERFKWYEKQLEACDERIFIWNQMRGEGWGKNSFESKVFSAMKRIEGRWLNVNTMLFGLLTEKNIHHFSNIHLFPIYLGRLTKIVNDAKAAVFAVEVRLKMILGIKTPVKKLFSVRYLNPTTDKAANKMKSSDPKQITTERVYPFWLRRGKNFRKF